MGGHSARNLHLGGERGHAGLDQGLYIAFAEFKAVCYLLQILNCNLAGSLIAFSDP